MPLITVCIPCYNRAAVLPALLDLRQPIPLLNAAPEFVERMHSQQQRLMQFYRSSLHAYDGDREAWSRDIREAAAARRFRERAQRQERRQSGVTA